MASSNSTSASPRGQPATGTEPESERTPLLRSPERERPKSSRTVTFNPNPVTKTIFPEPASLSTSPTPGRAAAPLSGVQSTTTGGSGSGSGVASGSGPGSGAAVTSLNNRLRRRNSHGGVPFSALPGAAAAAGGNGLAPKIGPQRSSKTAQKLKLLPNPELDDDGADEESGRDVYSQYTRIKDPNARRDAARLGKADRDRLPRVTAYCTANKYVVDGLMRYLKGKAKLRGCNPKLIDECIYTPYNYGNGKAADRGVAEAARVQAEEQVREQLQQDQQNQAVADEEEAIRPVQTFERRHSTGQLEDSHEGGAAVEAAGTDGFANGPDGFINGRDMHNNLAYPPLPDEESAIQEEGRLQRDLDFDTTVHTPEVFLFDYGVVVIWGMTLEQEKRFLKEIAKFETDKLAPADVETECFNFYYTREYQARIYNDFITLRDKGNYMTKLAISHALAQSVKTSLFEELIASTIDTCKDIPTRIALTGKIALSRTQINMQIGELFILRINIHLNGSVLDTPELFWVEPHLEPVYQAVRSYLEMDQRVGLLTERLDVIADLLAVLKDQLSHGHGEMLEWIVIVLIAAEILVAAVNIVVDLYAGVD